MKLFISRQLSREVMSGAPAVLAAVELDLKAKGVGGELAIWQFKREDDGFVIFDQTPPLADERIALPGIPTRVSVIVAADDANGRDLLEAWKADGARVDPPLIVAQNAVAAFCGIAEAMSRQVAETSRDYTRLNESLVAIRAELEQTRSAMSRLVGLLSTKPSSAIKLALATTPASSGLAIALEPGKWLRQKLGLAIDGISGLGVHLGRVAAQAASVLHVRLLAMESDEILGAWRVPASDLKPGWLIFDLPTPIAALRQTACMEIGFDASDEDRLSVSLDGNFAFDDTGYINSTGRTAKHMLALRVWTAQFGSRFVAPRYWLWDEVGVALPLGGLMFRLTSEDWKNIHVVTGLAQSVKVAEEPRPVILLDDKPACLLTLRLGEMNAMQAVQVVLTVASGSAAALSAEVSITGEGRPLLTENDVEESLASARRSGRRKFDPTTGKLTITLRLPSAPEDARQLIVHVVKSADEIHPALVELSDVATISRAFPQPAEWGSSAETQAAMAEASAKPGSVESRDPLPSPLAAEPKPDAASKETRTGPTQALAFEEIQVNQLFEQGEYIHVDVTVSNLSAGLAILPAVRMKMCANKGVGLIEFRKGARWPEVFGAAVTFQSDSHGEVLRLDKATIARLLNEKRGSEVERQIRAILGNLPSIAALATRQVAIDPEMQKGWLAGLTELAKGADEAVGGA